MKNTIKPWGSFRVFSKNEKTTVKIITIDAGNRTSLQFHNHRSEKWFIIKGNGILTLNNNKKIKAGDEIDIPLKAAHRIEAITDLMVLEISFGTFDESDIIRLEDDYGRES